MNIKVSVIVPVYNVEKYIDKCLYSLVNQSLKEIEIIVVNDGSVDNSQTIVDQYKNLYPEKILSLTKNNGGLSDARNFGLKYASGKYIAFIDSDDYVDSNMMDIMYNKAVATNALIVQCGFYMVYSDKVCGISVRQYKDIREYMIQGRVNAWNKLYNRKWLENCRIEFPKGLLYEDIAFFFYTASYSSNRIATIELPLIYYIQRPDSICGTVNDKILEIHDIFYSIKDFFINRKLYVQYKEEIEYRYAVLVCCSFLLAILKGTCNSSKKVSLAEKSLEKLNLEYPKWKKNKYFRRISMKHLYMKILSPALIQLMTMFL